jgi:hypothetical protein
LIRSDDITIGILLQTISVGIPYTVIIFRKCASAFAEDDYGVWNTDGYRLQKDADGNVIGSDQNFDGGSIKAGLNYGVNLD